VAAARRRAAELGDALGFDELAAGRVAIVVTEAATNVVRHGGGGEIYLGVAGSGQSRGLQIVAMDRGPGMRDVSQSLRDGFSTAGTAGNGLGAISRVATTFDLYSSPGRGTVLAAAVFQDGEGASFAAITVPIPGESVCGDAWAAWSAGELTSIFVVDGLGHGEEAAAAARCAVEAFERHAERSTHEVLTAVHGALKSTRGGAVAIAELDRRHGTLKYSGLGNISARIVSADGGTHHLVSLPGIAGHAFRRLQQFAHPWPPGALVILHSDGISTHWSLLESLLSRRPDVIAGSIYRDHRRGRDDATVVVARNET
jgi:anti-sigma regulatory factor (Ser/Thr protein kinase)